MGGLRWFGVILIVLLYDKLMHFLICVSDLVRCFVCAVLLITLRLWLYAC